MGDRLEAQISAIENSQEEFGHDIRKVKEHLARLTSLFEDHIKTQTVHSRGQSPSPNQWVYQPFVQTMSYMPRKTDRPNLRQLMPTAPPAVVATCRLANQPIGSRDKPSKQKSDNDKPRWDLIPVTYTELFPKLVEIGHIEPVYFSPLRPPFPRWYNARTRCDYHAGNPDHSMKNCTALKHKVQDLINLGKVKFEELDDELKLNTCLRQR